MRLLTATAFIAMGAGVLGLGSADLARADDNAACFDKGALAFVDCPGEADGDVWTGFYIGLHAGYGDADISGTFFDESVGLDPQLNFGGLELNGLVVGGQAGYLQSLGDVAIGLEIDGSYFDSEDTVVVAPGDGEESATAHVKALASLRARLGLPLDNVLPFITAGVGIVDYDVDFVDPSDNAVGVERSSVSETVFAPVVGGGLEVLAFSDVSIRAEGLYYFVDEKTDFSALGDSDVGSAHELGDIWVLRGAVNYRF